MLFTVIVTVIQSITVPYDKLKKISQVSSPGKPKGIDPKRLMKAKYLSVSRDSNKYIVSGGSEPHVVKPGEKYSCDCMDYIDGTQYCKHILAVMIENEEINPNVY